MSKVQWQPQYNALTTPRSCKAQVVPKDSLGYDEMAALIAAKNPVWSPGLVKSILLAEREVLKEQLLIGNKISYEKTCTWHLSISARLNNPDDPLPPDAQVNVQIYASKPFNEELRKDVELERKLPDEKVPVISGAVDTVLKLNDVLNPDGVLRLAGKNLLFNPSDNGCECVIEGTRSGRAVQTRFAQISNAAIIMVPQLEVQDDQWNNEYQVLVSTRYTKNGSLRTGSYSRWLRTPLSIMLGNDDGLLSGAGAAALVTAGTGTLTGDSARVRVQAVLDAQDGDLLFNLLDMTEGGAAGDAVRVTANGSYTLPGYAGSALTSISLTVHDYAALSDLVREGYTGRLVDILDVTQGS